MGDAIVRREAVLHTLSDSPADFDKADDFFLGGFWLETTDGPDFMPADKSTSSIFRPSSFCLSSDFNNVDLSAKPIRDIVTDDKETVLLSDCQSTVGSQSKSPLETPSLNRSITEISGYSGQTEPHSAEGSINTSEMISPVSEFSRGGWIHPQMNSSSASVKDRLVQALDYIKEMSSEENVLVQVWVPIKRGGRNVLTTSNQPFWHGPNCQQLVNYRRISTNYQFVVEENSNKAAGLPGRVFLGKVPEWTPDVRFFSREEYPRVADALKNGVHGTLAVPVFEQGSCSCLGVLEVVLTTQRIQYHSELESICRALQAVDLRTSEIPNVPLLKEGSRSCGVALPEILELLRVVCKTQGLPLAQTWVPCIQQGKRGSRHFEENCISCVSTVHSACCVNDPCVLGFHEACSEHHLLRGQGLVGKAFTTNQPCFSTDITAFPKAEYPLSHYAKMFGLRAAVAIRLRSTCTGVLDYVLEFFLPVECRDSVVQKHMLNSLSFIIEQVCQSLRVVTDEELQEENLLSVTKLISSGRISPEPNCAEGDCESQLAKPVPIEASIPKKIQQLEPLEIHAALQKDRHGGAFPELKHPQDSARIKLECGNDPFGETAFLSGGKGAQKRRAKAEKTISLQVLHQYFTGSLKDAAKSIGVCPTTLKRICRQHGITRWPSRKIKKVGHSLRKLQVVIDSVQGAEGTFQISSLHANFPKLCESDIVSPNLSRSTIFSSLKPMEPSASACTTPTDGTFNTVLNTTKSPSSSCSQSSSSGLCCSSSLQKSSHTGPTIGNKDKSAEGDYSGIIKRAYSEAELYTLIKEDREPPPRSLSNKPLSEHPSLGYLSSLPKCKKSHVRQPGCPRVKVSCGNEKLRFSLQPSWCFQDLIQEVASRFSIEDTSVMDVKYLDDNSEWVLLTCDTDLQECKDEYMSSASTTIKLLVHQKNSCARSSLGSSGALSQLS